MNRDNVVEEIDTILINNEVSFYEAIGILETVKQVLFKVAEAKEILEEQKEKMTIDEWWEKYK